MEYSRRTVLRLSAVTAATLAVSAPAAAAPKRTGPTRLVRNVFAPLVGTTFTLGGSRAKLVALRDLSAADAGSPDRFSLLFSCAAPLPAATYDVTHPSLQAFRLYVGPVGQTAGYLEAVVYG